MININPNEIHLWYSYDETIQDHHLLDTYLSLLDDKEREQRSRFHFKKHRHQYLITRAMVRTILSLYADNISPEQWAFAKNDYGKPCIANPLMETRLNFNLSHTENLILMGVTLDNEIGVDVEYLPRIGNMLDIANRFFSPLEIKQLHELPIEEQKERFFDLWTLKEAYIKACGMGLSIPLDEFNYSFRKGKINISFDPVRKDQPELWQFWQVTPSNDYKASVAIKASDADTNYSINMRKIVPLSKIMPSNLPISHGCLSKVKVPQVAPAI
ncbi:MAG: 4'-phosphopantetheinyl transferase superfamily protein [Kangiellaceae bacterium]|nr:4'-phosphopantetheinyl transferase superfamily protein [Kangiellaceae bacterium]MCW9018391.1 4'-phosphopantetheinyl transferase superfamily protein [Kangiellaceae bacterium]